MKLYVYLLFPFPFPFPSMGSFLLTTNKPTTVHSLMLFCIGDHLLLQQLLLLFCLLPLRIRVILRQSLPRAGTIACLIAPIYSSSIPRLFFMVLMRGWQTFSAGDQIVYISGFSSDAVSVVNNQFFHCSTKASWTIFK